MFVQQIEFDHAAKVCLNEGGINDIGEMTISELQQAAVEQFGAIVGNVQDPDNESRIIGWKFQAEAKYDEAPEGESDAFTLETWIVIHDKLPEVRYFYAEIDESNIDPAVGPAVVATDVENS